MIKKQDVLNLLDDMKSRIGNRGEDEIAEAVLDMVINKVQGMEEVGEWIPVEEEPPENDNYILVSFENYILPDIGQFRIDEDGGGAFYPADEEKSYSSIGLFVNAWMKLPECYREDRFNQTLVADTKEPDSAWEENIMNRFMRSE